MTSKSPYDKDLTLCNNSTRHDKTKTQMPAELSNPFLDEDSSTKIFKSKISNKSKNAYKNHFEELTDDDEFELDQSDNFDKLMDNSSESNFDDLYKYKMV